MNKKYLIFILVILILILTYGILKISVKDVRIGCALSGGTWKMFSDGCADNCAFVRATKENPIFCTQAFQENCDCGPLRCWDYKTKLCVLN